MKRRNLLAVLVAGTALTFSVQPAQAQIGTCPLLTPAPCITFDYKKMADWATTHAQDLQKMQQTIAQIREMEAQVKTIGESINNISQLSPAPALSNMSVPGKAYTTFDAAVADFAPKMFYGSEDRTLDDQTAAASQRQQMVRNANAEAFAYSQQNCRMIQESRTRMRELHAAARSSTDLRGDWNVNSQIRTELVRTTAQKNVLLAAFLELQAVQLANNVDDDTPTQVSPYGSSNPAPARTGVSLNSQNLIELYDVVNSVRKLLTNSNSAEASRGVIAGNEATISDYEQTLAARNAAFTRLQSSVNAWAREENRSGQPVIDRVLAELNSMDASSAALREQPIETLGSAFASRNIDAQALISNNVDPRQFIGTWTDPLKFQNTNAMSENLARNVFGKIFDQGGERDDFIKLVYAYNDLRLQEAWMREYAAEARNDNVTVNANIVDLNEEEGITLNTSETAARLKELVNQANQLADIINSSASESEKAKAATALKQIQDAIRDSTLVSSVEVPNIPTTPTPGTTPGTQFPGTSPAPSGPSPTTPKSPLEQQTQAY